jgi:uncharacterized membrane protein HdeD (DUF308 family)
MSSTRSPVRWILALRGILVVIVGLTGLWWPHFGASMPGSPFGVGILADGTIALLAYSSARAGAQRWWAMLEGVAGVVLGTLILIRPGLTASRLLGLVGAWSAYIGLLDIVGAAEANTDITEEWLPALGGLLMMASGAFIALYPRAATLGIVNLLGAYLILFGGILMILGVRLGLQPAEVPSARHDRSRKARPINSAPKTSA